MMASTSSDDKFVYDNDLLTFNILLVPCLIPDT